MQTQLTKSDALELYSVEEIQALLERSTKAQEQKMLEEVIEQKTTWSEEDCCVYCGTSVVNFQYRDADTGYNWVVEKHCPSCEPTMEQQIKKLSL